MQWSQLCTLFSNSVPLDKFVSGLQQCACCNVPLILPNVRSRFTLICCTKYRGVCDHIHHMGAIIWPLKIDPLRGLDFYFIFVTKALRLPTCDDGYILRFSADTAFFAKPIVKYTRHMHVSSTKTGWLSNWLLLGGSPAMQLRISFAYILIGTAS